MSIYLYIDFHMFSVNNRSFSSISGLFRRADKKLVCSALSNYTGGIFVLYSDPEFRGRGFAKIVVQHMVKELRRRGRIPFCTVMLGNTASEKVFSKSGFEAFSTAHYVFPK